MITQPITQESRTESVMNDTFAPNPSPQDSTRREDQPRKGPRIGLRILGITILVVGTLVVALHASTISRSRQQQAVNDSTAAKVIALPRVTVVVAKRMASDTARVLPGNSLPFAEASIYARTTGYLQNWKVDIGDRVKEGQLLAEISAPDVDAQVFQAEANLAQSRANLQMAKANEELAKSEEFRYRKLVGTDAVSKEDYETKLRTVKVASATIVADEANIKVNEASLQRFKVLQGFQKITAPFHGVITARNVDPGDLLMADATTNAKEMFHLMRTDVLRVFANVPQVFSTNVKIGQDAIVYPRDDPKKQFPGKVTRTANALDPNTRTLLTEVDVPNPNDVLRPGMYLQVKFVFDRSDMQVMIPAAALATRTGTPRVAVLDTQNRVHYREIQLGRDYGAEIAVISGLNPGETVVVHPGDDLPEGTEVEPVPVPN